jgi:phosphoserine phosphatase SerB
MAELLLLSISGAGHPGVTAAFTDHLAGHRVNVLDIGPTAIHGRLNLGMLIEIPDAVASDAVMKGVLFLPHQHDLEVDFSPVAASDYEDRVASPGRPRFIVTLLGRKLRAANISHVAAVVARHRLNIDAISRLSGRFSLRERNVHCCACVECSIRGLPDGTERLISKLKQLGYRISILSAGFTYFANHLKERLGLDCVSANELDIVDGRLTGRVKGEIVNGEKKAERLRQMAHQLGIDMRQTIAVGDGANDLPMLAIAGPGVAFHATPVVRDNARHAISTLGLDSILYFLGVREREVVA